jgi:hypothetical protein
MRTLFFPEDGLYTALDLNAVKQADQISLLTSMGINTFKFAAFIKHVNDVQPTLAIIRTSKRSAADVNSGGSSSRLSMLLLGPQAAAVLTAALLAQLHLLRPHPSGVAPALSADSIWRAYKEVKLDPLVVLQQSGLFADESGFPSSVEGIRGLTSMLTRAKSFGYTTESCVAPVVIGARHVLRSAETLSNMTDMPEPFSPSWVFSSSSRTGWHDAPNDVIVVDFTYVPHPSTVHTNVAKAFTQLPGLLPGVDGITLNIEGDNNVDAATLDITVANGKATFIKDLNLTSKEWAMFEIIGVCTAPITTIERPKDNPAIVDGPVSGEAGEKNEAGGVLGAAKIAVPFAAAVAAVAVGWFLFVDKEEEDEVIIQEASQDKEEANFKESPSSSASQPTQLGIDDLVPAFLR